MIATLILAAVLPGQICAQGTYRQAAVTRAYTVPLAYQPAYAAASQVAYTTAYAPVVYADFYSIVGDQQRTFDRRLEALKGQADIALRLDKIATSLQGLNALAANPPAIQAAPDSPSKPLPPVPAKPSPQSPDVPGLPPTPKVNPDDGSVPPPPPVPSPGTAGSGRFSPASHSVFDNRCQRCHSVAYAPKQGGGYVMYNADGSVRTDFTAPEMLEIVRRISIAGNEERMPRKAVPLTPDEKAPIILDAMSARAVTEFLTASK